MPERESAVVPAALPSSPVPVALAGPGQAVQLAAELPEMLLSMLERRYLSAFQPSMWELEATSDDGVRPLLREVLALGREQPGHEWSQAMPHVLTATHVPGQAVVFTVHGEGARHRVHYGTRRLASRSQGSTEDFLDGQSSVLQAHIPGIQLGPPTRLDSPAMGELAELIRSAPALAVVTGVPSASSASGPSSFQNIDRLVDAVGSRRYALVVVAEPLGAAELDLTIDRCRRLKGDVHSLVRRTVSRSISDGESRTTTTPDETTSLSEIALPATLYGLAAFCSLAGLVTGAAPLLQMGTPLMLGAGISRQLNQTRKGSASSGTTHAQTDSGSAEFLDATAEACETLLQRHIDRLDAARSSGWWRTSIYVAAENEGTLQAVTGALRGMASGAGSGLDPVRVVRPSPHLVRAAATLGLPLRLIPAASGMSHPLGEPYDALGSCMTTGELAVLVTPPRRDIPGLPVHDVGAFALSAAPPRERSIELGALQDPMGRPLARVGISAESLNRHVLITGMTGYGKSTTAKRLLLETYRTLDVPFLVIEPVKAEYRRLAGHPDLRDRLRLFTIGDPAGLPLRLNPFSPLEGVPLLRHIDLLKAVFNAAFPMFAGMSYVLEEAMLSIYTDRGWVLDTSQNRLLGRRPSPEDVSAVVPSLADLHDKVEVVLQTRGYGKEIQQNIGAALRARLRSLMVGAKGKTLNTVRSVPSSELFTQPCVIELRNLGDDEEKAFVMALLLCQLYEFAEARQSDRGAAPAENLQHLTLIEEAHRLLRPARAPGSPESPDAQAKAVTMFTDMLAEMRAYGEGFVVADQIPTKLAPEIVKNSSVKILHRLVAPDDRAVVAAATNLTEAQSRHLGTLHPGFAVVHDDQIASAVLVQVAPLPGPTGSGPPAGAKRRTDLAYLHQNAACRACPRPCELLDETRLVAEPDEIDNRLEPFFRGVLDGDVEHAWRVWTDFAVAWTSRARDQIGEVADDAIYCAASQSAHRFVDRLGRYREEAVTAAGKAASPGEQLLTRSRCARAMGRLCHAWLHAAAPTAETASAFADTHAVLAEQLAERPPHELPGCAECPARCRAFVAVAPLLPTIRQPLRARATAATPVATRARSIASIDAPAFRVALRDVPDEAGRRALLYCGVVNATAECADQPWDLLAELRTTP